MWRCVCVGGRVAGGKPVEVKCFGVCNSGDMGRRKREVCVLGKIEGGSRADRGQVKDHPMRGDLKAGVRFYEFGLSATRVHAHTDTCAGLHIYKWWASNNSLPNPDSSHVSVFTDPRAPLRYGYRNNIQAIVIQKKFVHFKILTTEVLISRLLQLFMGCSYRAAAFSKLCMILLLVRIEGSAADTVERTVIPAVSRLAPLRTHKA